MDVELVNLLCTVRDRSGTYLSTLSQDDFMVLDNGRRQAITRFARLADQPLTVALLFDVSSKIHNNLTTETDNARHFFRNILRPGDNALLAGFAASVGIWQPVTSSPQVLEQALNQVPGVAERLRKVLPSNMSVKWQEKGPSGMTAIVGGHGSKLFDAVDVVSAKQLRQLPGRKAIIALTDGIDDGSQRTRKEAVRSMLAADAIFYGIHCTDDMGEGMGNLKDLSAQTGGSAFHIDKNTTLDSVLHSIEEQLRSQYAIGYAPPDSLKNGAFHKVEVRVTKPDLSVQARQGYFR